MSKRIEIVDAWRSLAIVCMVVYHFLIDLNMFGYISDAQMYCPALNVFQQCICISFILISGISARYSKNSIRRGAIVLLGAAAVSVAGLIVSNPIRFGILHFLGFAMIFYGLLGKYFRQIPRFIAPILFLGLFITTKIWTDGNIVESQLLFPFGFMYPGFYSADFFPILPWIFMFLLGTWLGGELRRYEDLPLFRMKFPRFVTYPGRHSLVIYLLHQPLMYGAFVLFNML